MANVLDRIATVDISIESPIVYDVSFGNLLLVGPLPSDTTAEVEDFGAYSSLTEVLDAGWSLTANDPIAYAAQVAFSQSPIPATIYIVPQKVKTPAVDDTPAVYETAAEAVTRALEYTSWYVVCPAGVKFGEIADLAALIEANERMMVYSDPRYFSGYNGTVGTGRVGNIIIDEGIYEAETPLVPTTYERTVGIYSAEYASQLPQEVPAANLFMNVAFTAKWLNYEPGSETTAFKMLNAVAPADLSSTNINKLIANNINYYLKIGNRNVTMLGKTMAGEWADIIRFRDWLKNDMQTRVVNLFITNPKVPYTDAGIALIQNQMIASLQRGQQMGGIAGDEFDVIGNKIPGFSTSVPLASSMTVAERASRNLTGCKFSARLAGAIHHVEIKGSLTYVG